MFSCEFYEVFRRTYFVEHLQAAVSENPLIKQLIYEFFFLYYIVKHLMLG